MQLACKNCGNNVPPNDAKFFGATGKAGAHTAIFLCSTCFAVADALHKRGLEELKHIAAMLGENIRLACLRGELSLATAEPGREVTKREVLQHIVQMMEKDPPAPGR